jgi:hypothetical protein
MAKQQQTKIKFPCGWGGKRKGAGRPAKGPRPSELHQTRPTLRASEPVHVTMRVAPDLGNMRKRDMYNAIRWATNTAALRHQAFRICHFTIQGSHLHMICEAANKTRLARGVQGFEVSAARKINAAISKRRGRKRKGAVFPDRYHLRILKTPTQVKRAINYVLNNWRHHGEHRRGFARTWLLDPYSSGCRFTGWTELDDRDFMWPLRRGYEPLFTWLPKTWLLARGWRRAGNISVWDVPAVPAVARA